MQVLFFTISNILFSSSPVELHKILAYIHQLPPVEKEEDCISDADYLLELLISRHEKRKSQQERVNEMPLYPTEKIIWDENIVPVEYFSGEGITSIWKYNFGNLMKILTIYRKYDVYCMMLIFIIKGKRKNISVFR